MQKLEAVVQYGDFRGEAKADNADHGDIQALAKKHGISGAVVAVAFFSGETGKPYVYIHTAADDSVAFDDIEETAKQNGGVLHTKRHRIDDLSYAEFFELFKRFNIVLRYRYPSVSEIEYEDA